MNTLFQWLSSCLLIGISYSCQAVSLSTSDCLALARTYYEQLYCELHARGEAKRLPDFYQFRKNPAQTQALLLKRPAMRAGIEIKMPVRQSDTPRIKVPASTPEPSKRSTSNPCVLAQQQITCAGKHFILLSNRHNRHLQPQALSEHNKMALPTFSGDIQQQAQVRHYLYDAYVRYLDAMRRIGLGGVTTSFGKFSYLFYDYHERGINFEQRFEQLYHYLKKDKASLPVSESLPDTQQLTISNCAALANRYMVCSLNNRNLVFAAN